MTQELKNVISYAIIGLIVFIVIVGVISTVTIYEASLERDTRENIAKLYSEACSNATNTTDCIIGLNGGILIGE